MEIILSSSQISTITRHCEQAYPEEACGIMIGISRNYVTTVVQVIPTKNAREPQAQFNRYSIPALDLLRGEEIAESLNLLVVGYFHSHPNHTADPSSTDLELAWPGYSYMIISIRNGITTRIHSWRLRNDRSKFDEEMIRINYPDHSNST